MNIRQTLRIIFGVFFIALSAQLTVNIGTIPITGQTLAILIIALIFNQLESIFSVLAYILLGSIGLPFFADGSSGIDKLLGPSGGFIAGFLISTIAVSTIKTNISRFNILVILQLNVLGTLLIILCGILRLSYQFGIQQAFEYGFYPFWKGAIIKIFLGTLAVWIYDKVNHIK